jgi:glycosyltransferase involved in cell wall biosynthesis
MTEDLVSIGMPLLNGASLLEGALESLLAQTHRNFELLIGDNASDDASREICERYALQDSRIKYLRYEERVPAPVNFNRLIERASGKYFMWAAFDDLWAPTFVESLLVALQRRPDAVLAFCRFDDIDYRGNIVRTFDHRWDRVVASSRFRQFAAFMLRRETETQKANFVYGLMTTEAIRTAGGIRQHKRSYSGADVMTVLRMLAQGPFAYVDEILFHYRIRDRVVRAQQPLSRYLIERAFGNVSGHSSNLFRYLLFHHEFHQYVRRFALGEMPLGRAARLLLWTAVWIKELVEPTLTVPKAFATELRLTGRLRG